MMLAANVAVAKFLHGKNIPALYRIHEPPNEQAIALLEKYMMTFGGKTKLNQGKLQKRLTKALEEFKGRPEAQILNILTLRSMSQAKYSPNNVGHFGLGFEFYAHFTSPIRRYPDLIIHRLIKNQVVKNSNYRLLGEDDLATAGTILSAAEQRSTKAERQVQSIKKARFMERFVGQEFDGIISSVARFGVFVLLREYDCDGLIRLEDLGRDKFEYDEESLKLIALRSGFSYSIGDSIRIMVAAADPELGQVNFVRAGEEPVVRKEIRKEKRTEKTPYSRNQNKEVKKETADKGKAFSLKDDRERRKKSKHDEPRHSKGSGSKQNSRFFGDSRADRDGQAGKQKKAFQQLKNKKESSRFEGSKNEKPSKTELASKFKPSPSQDHERKGPDENLLRMILGPVEYRKSQGEDSTKDKAKLSKKLLFAENSKLRDNDLTSENNSDSLKDRKSDRKDPKKRRKTKENSQRVRKTRVSSARGKGKTR